MIISKKSILYDMLQTLPLAMIATFISILSWKSINFPNLTIAFFSSFLFIYAVNKMFRKKKINSHLIFLFSFYVGLYFNTFMLSSFQTEKDFIDIYYFFIGPLFFYFILYFFEIKDLYSVKYRKKIVNINVLYLLFLSSYIILKLYISSLVGWRISTFYTSSHLQVGTLYSVSGYSGLAAILQWILVIFSLYTKRKYAIVALISIIIFSYLHVKRGDILRIAVFYLLFYSFNIFYKHNSIKLKNNFKNIFKIVIMIILLLGVFVYLGNRREELRGSSEMIMANNIGIKDAPSYLSWFYGYIPINYEVVRFYFNVSPTYHPNAILNTIISQDVNNFNSEYSINGFNASTILTTFIKDYGEFYFLEMILFAIIIGFLIKLAKREKFTGCYIFILMILSYSFFGNYFEARSMFVTIVISLVIFPFLKIAEKSKIPVIQKSSCA